MCLFTFVAFVFPRSSLTDDIAFGCICYSCPVFIVHGKEDPVVPFEHGKYLYEAVPEEYRSEPYWVDGMGHNHYSRQVGIELMKRINQFLDFHVLARRLWMLPSYSDDEYEPRPRRLLQV